MNTLSFIKDNSQLLIIIGIVLASLIILAIILTLVLKRKKKVKVLPVNKEELESIYQALGDKNIVSIDKEQDRLKLVLVDPKKVDANILTTLKIPAFLKGKEVKILYRNHSNELYEYIKTKLDV